MGRRKKISCKIEENAQKLSGKLLKEDVRCPVCLYILVEPVTMPCKHSACKTCFLSILKQTTLQCPVCRGRVGNFARQSMKSGKLINTGLWSDIQHEFKEELLLQQFNSIGKVDIMDNIVGDPAEPGEIREEFEKQMVLIHEANKDKDRVEQEEKDRRLAAALQDALNSSASLTRQQVAEQASGEKKPLERMGGSQEDAVNSLTKREGLYTPQSSSAAQDSKEESDSEGHCSDQEPQTSDKISSRRLFENLNLATSEMDKKQTSKSRKRKVSSGKENSEVRRKKKYWTQTKQFPGCSKRPRLAGTADLSISYADSEDDDEGSVTDPSSENSKKCDNTKKKMMTSCRNGEVVQHRELTKSSDVSASIRNQMCDTADSEAEVSFESFTDEIQQSSSSSLGKNEQSEKIRRSRKKSESNKGAARRVQKSKRCGQPQKRSSGSTAGSASSVTVCGPTAVVTQASDHLYDDAISLLQDLPVDMGRSMAVVAEQRAIEAQLRQEAEDAKFARCLQRHLASTTVDRTQGSGEEYGLRPRSRRTPPTIMLARDASPCY
ncbi:Zinc finger RING-type [Trinorchestia longiramus]|nr:Zinc finger RING-type [Trinorchestia longiramus]